MTPTEETNQRYLVALENQKQNKSRTLDSISVKAIPHNDCF